MFGRRAYQYGDWIKDEIRGNKLYIIIFALFSVLGVAAGIFRATQFETAISIDTIKIKFIREFLIGGKSAFGFVFSRSMYDIIIVAISGACLLVVITIPASVVVLFYRGYIMGLNLVLAASLIGSGASVVIWIIVFPIELIVLLLYSLICSNGCKFAIEAHRFGRNKRLTLAALKSTAVLVVLVLVVGIIEGILLSFLSNSFILSV